MQKWTSKKQKRQVTDYNPAIGRTVVCSPHHYHSYDVEHRVTTIEKYIWLSFVVGIVRFCRSPKHENIYGKYFDPDMPLDLEQNNPFRHLEEEQNEIYNALELLPLINVKCACVNM